MEVQNSVFKGRFIGLYYPPEPWAASATDRRIYHKTVAALSAWAELMMQGCAPGVECFILTDLNNKLGETRGCSVPSRIAGPVNPDREGVAAASIKKAINQSGKTLCAINTFFDAGPAFFGQRTDGTPYATRVDFISATRPS